MVGRLNPGITDAWLTRLGLVSYGPPDLITRQDQIPGTQYAGILRAGFEILHLDGFLCIQHVPTIAFLVRDERNDKEITQIHRALWNQGTTSLLLVLLPDQALAYSLLAPPIQGDVPAKDRRLIQTFDLVASGLELAELISGVQSGRYFEEHAANFDMSTRVDSVLVDNLAVTYEQLSATGLAADNAHALLMQVMFIAYLEDRGLIDREYVRVAVGDQKIVNLLTLLHSGDPQPFHRLFKRLNKNFNSDIFLAPCAFGAGGRVPALKPKHLHLLAEFRRGTVDFKSGQGRFWPYEFQFIPVELISAVYDRLLANTPERKREGGVYYTPSFLADFVVDQAWDELPFDRRMNPHFKVLDPACGSAIFLVRIFHRMVEDWRSKHQGARPTWKTLVAMVHRLHGWDKQESAVRIGAFSLYIALLEQVPRAELGKLHVANKLLPPLFGANLLARDFFDEKNPPQETYDLIIGNPPWVSRKKTATATATRWCKTRNLPMPANELAWGFVWRALELVKKPQGLTAFLLPAMGMLLNLEDGPIAARKIWLARVRLHRVVNLADTSFLLFEGAKRPTVLCLYTPASGDAQNYTFEYWCPKASRFLGYARMLALTNSDKVVLSSSKVIQDPRTWSRHQWTANRDLKLLDWLGTLPKLNERLVTYRDSLKKGFSKTGKRWIIGQGFQPAQPENIGKKGYHTERLPILNQLPYMPATDIGSLVAPNVEGSRVDSNLVRRKGYVEGFSAPHVLIPQGIERRSGLLRAVYSEQPCCFQHSLQAIRFPAEDAPWLKLLTAVLNSKFTAWYLFHETGNLGADRAKVHEWELGELPFPMPEDLANPNAARKAVDEIVVVMDELLRNKDRLLAAQRDINGRLDALVYAYYGLSGDEIAVVEDTVKYVVASMQPRLRRQTPPLWITSRQEHWQAYANTLSEAVERWLKSDFGIETAAVGASQDLVVLRLTMRHGKPTQHFQQQLATEGMTQLLARIHAALPRKLSRNLMLIPDLRVFLDNDLYIVKPRAMRYWLRSAALNDADGIVEELFTNSMDQGQRKNN